MAGFRFCSWCQGKGCMCCDGERVKWEKWQAAEAKRKAEQDPRDRLRELQSPLLKAIAQSQGPEFAAALDREIADAQAACDAEYRRQFPDGPKPIFTAKRGTADIALMKSFVGIDALNRAFGPDGGGMAEIEAGAERARATQAFRDYAYSADAMAG
jgi:hypothetical protein